MRSNNMQDYEPALELHDGEVTDMLIEEVLSHIYHDYYDADQFDQVYTGIVQSHINEDCPFLMASHAGKDRVNAGAVHYLAMLRLDYLVICNGSPHWPVGGFDFMPDAQVAVAIYYPDNHEQITNFTPGKSINQASLGSLIQLAREKSLDHHNQPSLDLAPPKFDA